MSIEIQKQIKENATDVAEYRKDLLRWAEDEDKKEERRERKRLGRPPATSEYAKTNAPNGAGKLNDEELLVKASIDAFNSAAGVTEQAQKEPAEENEGAIKRDGTAMHQYYTSWDQYDVDDELERIEEAAHSQQRAEAAARQYEKDRILDELEFAGDGDRKRTSKAKPRVKISVRTSGRRASPVDLAIPRKEEANRYFAEGRFREAVATYTSALDLLEKYEPPGQGDGKEAAVDGVGQETEALQVKTACLANRALALLKLEEWREAAIDCTEALRFDPLHGKATARRGLAFARMRIWSKAAADLRLAVKWDPADKKALAELQMVDRKLEEQNKEARAHAKAMMCDPTRNAVMPTRKLNVAVQAANSASRRARGEEEEEPADEEGGEREVKKRPKELSDAELDRRVPLPAMEAWKYLETLALSLGQNREKLRPHVVAAGVLYGNGEETFNELFQAAWLTQPVHTILHPGDNFLPCVHVRDVARLVKVIATDSSVGRYLVAVDRARLTQSQIVHGIVKQISNPRDIPIVAVEESKSQFTDIMTMDLIMEPSKPMKSKNFQWWCKEGIVANLDKVADEFTTWRNLRPIKMIIMGPPGSGAERYGDLVADRYLHADPPHYTFEQILQDACATRPVLRAKVEKLKAKPGAKLPLKKRTELVRKRLLSNVCRYRGYVLRGYPESFEEAAALFEELVPEEGAEEEPPAEEEEAEEEEEEEEEAPPPPEEDEEEDEEGKPKKRVAAKVVPEFVVALQSTQDSCKTRIFDGVAQGAASEEEFLVKSAAWKKANGKEDGTPGTAEFFAEVTGVKVLHVDVDSTSEEHAFQAIRVYLEGRGQFKNYLRSEVDRVKDREDQIDKSQQAAELAAEKARSELAAAEEKLRHENFAEEARRRQAIADREAATLESEALPLRSYLMSQVVPTLTAGLSEVCKEQPEDPIEYLAQYLFAHAQDIEGPPPTN
mmetsp:Transcript_9580/g.21033  ORF Transcript_9580/g.21033 Transcript_9580/m.21033 type:complete len:954 (-) Transcript_9580:169-3030(-)